MTVHETAEGHTMVGPQAGVDRILDVDNYGCTMAVAIAFGVHFLVHPLSCQVLSHHILLRADSVPALQILNLRKDSPTSLSQAPDISCCRGCWCGWIGVTSCRAGRRCNARVDFLRRPLPVSLGPLVGVNLLVCVSERPFLL